jgi:hypothetical protein
MCERCVKVARAALEQKCGHFLTADTLCGKAATIHYRLGASMKLVCDEHKPTYFASHIVESHPVDTACGLPYAEWVDGYPSCCEIAGLNQLLLTVSAGKAA